ncbi:fam-m protein [Plasmodium malariae]|uniref:Fam-m protein n=1 Tax=Plasmodium malariae TaxID=5858 RepID=A0A1D3JM63_PLAMA|nr:fam-m protein [Plasmodium malariae]SBT87572.1 fam-m protein [Plasmodium malariae]
MEHKIKHIIFIKIFAFIFLFWICHLKSYMIIFDKSFEEYYNICRKLDTRIFRSLTIYKHDKDSYILGLKQNILNNTDYKKKNIIINKKEAPFKSKKSNKNLLNKAQYYTEVTDYSNGIFDGKHFHFEKKWIKRKNYSHFLEKKRRLCDIALGKIKFRHYRYGVGLFLIFIMLGILYIIGDIYVSWEKVGGKIRVNLESIIKIPVSLDPYTCAILYAIDIVIFSILIIITIPRILKNKEIYNKLKLMNE